MKRFVFIVLSCLFIGSASGLTATKDVRVLSNESFQSTGIILKAGMQYRVWQTGGKWTVDYRNFGYVNGAGYPPQIDRRIYQGCKYNSSWPYGLLLGKIRSHIFPIGLGRGFTAPEDGLLELGIHDASRCLADNAGSLFVRIEEVYQHYPSIASPKSAVVSAPSPTGGYPQIPSRFSRIEQVDFFNFTYPVGPSDCPNDFGPRKTVTLKDANYIEKFRDSTLAFGVDKNDIAYGDITGSHTGEAVIALSCSFMANFSTTTIYVYTLRNGVPTPLAKIPWDNLNKDYRRFWGKNNGPVWGVTSFKASKGRFTFEGWVDSPHACPANIARFIYTWNGSGFVLVGKPAKRKNPQC